MSVTGHNYPLAGLTLLVTLAAAMSCVRRPLDYEYVDYAAITIILDWTKAGINPNGATILFFPEDGSACIKKLTGRDTVSMNIGKGSYTILAFNETFNDLDNITFKGQDALSSIQACLKESGTRESNKETVYGEPEILACAVRPGFTVTYDLIEKTRALMTKTRAGTKALDSDLTVTLTPERVTHKVTVTAYVKGLSGMSSAGVYVQGFAGSVFLADGHYPDIGITQAMTFTDKVVTDESTSSGYLRGEYNCLGPKGGFDIKTEGYSADFRAAMSDGAVFEEKFDLTNAEMTYYSDTYGLSVNIVLASPEHPILLPEIEGGGGGWQIAVGEWEDINIPIEF